MAKKELSREAVRSRIASIAGRIAANKRVATPGYDGRQATRPATTAYWQKLEAEVDPEGRLPPGERLARAKKLFLVKMDEGKLKKAQSQLRKAG